MIRLVTFGTILASPNIGILFDFKCKIYVYFWFVMYNNCLMYLFINRMYFRFITAYEESQ